jgi:hypothetical protein
MAPVVSKINKKNNNLYANNHNNVILIMRIINVKKRISALLGHFDPQTCLCGGAF